MSIVQIPVWIIEKYWDNTGFIPCMTDVGKMVVPRVHSRIWDTLVAMCRALSPPFCRVKTVP